MLKGMDSALAVRAVSRGRGNGASGLYRRRRRRDAHHGDLRQGRRHGAGCLRPFHRRRAGRPPWSDRCSLPVPGHPGGPAVFEPGRQALVRRPARSRGLRDHADAAGSVRRSTTDARSGCCSSTTACRWWSGSPTGACRCRSSSRRARRTCGPIASPRCRRPSPARHERDRRCHPQRHLSPGPGRAQTARAVQRRSGRLFARAPRPLHRDLAAVRPALHPADQLPALRRPLRRLRAPGDRRGRQLFHFRRAGRRHHPQFAARRCRRRVGRRHGICRRCRRTT